ncbi:hypothetical protein [Pedobacter steynii]|nr:hypothetical protein [Pedobacter steynii]
MKKNISKMILLLLVLAASGCSIFKPGCKCPPVSYRSYPQR